MKVPELPTGCPWSGWAPPNIKWNEENLCGWITAPANTWSNVAYWLAALAIWRRATASRGLTGRAFAFCSVFIGAASFAFHASYTFFFQFFDYVAMFVLLFMVFAINLGRAGIAGPSARRRVWAALTAIACAGVAAGYKTGFPFQLFIPALVAVLAVQEHRLRAAGKGAGSYAWYARALAYLAAATAFTLLDLAGVLFAPGNHWVQGHALWHVLTAAAIDSAARFFEDEGYDL